MTTVLLVIGGAWIFVVCVLVLLLLVQVLAGFRRGAAAAAGEGRIPSFVVLVPAHDEAGGVGATVRTVRRQLPASGRVLVVADNCSDGTAAEAREAGAEVIERSDPLQRGKGHALAYGIQHLRQRPPEVVVILDADCLPAAGTLEQLAARAARLQRPTQALYRMLCSLEAPVRLRMAAFAWTLRNEVRPRGLDRLGLPCQLMGSGMGLPWSCVERVDLASGHLVEDLQLGLRLAGMGRAPKFCPDLCVASWFPEDGDGQASQRKRWEHGHLSMILSVVPATLRQGLRHRAGGAIALALDLCIPPLALLAVLVTVACGFGAALAGAGAAGQVAAGAALLAALGFVGAVLLAWWSEGRRWIAGAELLAAPLYVLRKLPLYAGFVLRRQKEWVRTSRQR